MITINAATQQICAAYCVCTMRAAYISLRFADETLHINMINSLCLYDTTSTIYLYISRLSSFPMCESASSMCESTSSMCESTSSRLLRSLRYQYHVDAFFGWRFHMPFLAIFLLVSCYCISLLTKFSSEGATSRPCQTSPLRL